MNKYICIHGHFYQPPRENAWLEVIEQQDSAAPFHDWNQRITSECYGPNAFSRILNNKSNIVNIVNNYAGMSFNFGATLLDWMQKNANEIYLEIIKADKLSMLHNDGHGSAMAQVYNHIIMPLADKRDKEIQVQWGIIDFEKRFERKPEGIWLAETAVDTETLEVLAENNITYTVLAPRQAHAVKKINEGTWTDVSGEKIDTTQPYLCKLPSGKSINLFFYNGNVSQAVAFKGLLKDGEKFANELMKAFSIEDRPQLVNIATDGESYGHHHKHGDMALAFCLKHITESKDVKLINYGNFLAKFPPTFEVQIIENSSWSCEHGIERWRNNCGCNSGGHSTWNQLWREPLRNSLNWLRDKLRVEFETHMLAFCDNPTYLLQQYIHVLHNRSEEYVNRFLKKHITKNFTERERTKIIRLLEMQRHGMLMFTSCGWFFDEVSGIETVQILQYADRAIQLAESECNVDFLPEFKTQLKDCPSNEMEYINAALLYEKQVLPARLTLGKVGMHYAVASLFEEYPESLEICNYKAESEIYERFEAGVLRLAVGKTKVHSLITFSEKEFYFAVIYLGQNHFIGNSSNSMETIDFENMHREIGIAFSESRVADVIGVMQTYFEAEKFSLWSLLKDEQRKILYQILQKDITQAEDSYKKIYNRNYNIMTVLKNAALPIPSFLTQNLETVINNEIRNYFKSNTLYPARLEKLATEVNKWQVKLFKEDIAFAATEKLFNLIQELATRYRDIKFMTMINRVLQTLSELEIELNVWQIQNAYFVIAKNLFFTNDESCIVDLKNDSEWIKVFNKTGEYLKVEVAK